MPTGYWILTVLALALIVGATFYDLSNAPKTAIDDWGVTRRWYDGTVEKRERYNSQNKKLVERQVYGEDGKTVIRYEYYGSDGDHLDTLTVREPDGKMRKREFEQDGKTLRKEQLLSADEKQVIELREYQKGILAKEEVHSDDGKVWISKALFYPDGKLKFKSQVVKGGDTNIVGYYPDGKLRKQGTVHLTGDAELRTYLPDGCTVSSEGVKTTEALVLKNYDSAGKLKRLTNIDLQWTKDSVSEVYNQDGKLAFRQIYRPDYSSTAVKLCSIEEFKDGKLTRRISPSFVLSQGWEVEHFDAAEKLITRRDVRSDGSVEQEDTFDETGRMTKTQYFATGNSPNVVETIDPALLLPPDLSNQFDE